jgi:hypothetical protein
MRVDPAVWETEGIVFAATLVPSEKAIIVEDILMYKGFASFFKSGFSKRWESTQKSLQEDVWADEDLMGGLKVRLRTIVPLAQTAELGVSEIIPEEAGRRRYLWIGRAQETAASPCEAGAAPAPSVTVEQPQPKDDTAIATKGAFPDQYFLSRIDGTKMGMAIVQDPGVSKEMRVKSKNNPQFRVHIKEAAEFAGSYEILSIV